MKQFFDSFVNSARILAGERGLVWNLPCDPLGKIPSSNRWDLTALVGMIPPPSIFVANLGVAPKLLNSLNNVRKQIGEPVPEPRRMPLAWRDLYLAVVIHQLLVRRNKPPNALMVARWISLLAAASGDTPPWATSPDNIRLAYNAALNLGDSGKNGLNFEMMVRTVLDDQHLADTPALARFCVPLSTGSALHGHEQTRSEKARVNGASSTGSLRRRLTDRKSGEKLPEQEAFWELIRIVFTEAPRTFSDAIRFSVLKLCITSGLRIGEVVMLPLDWCRWREYVDGDGKPAGEKGGISRSLMIRHFAEKQVDDQNADGVSLFESAQHVPPMFEELVLESLRAVEQLTKPLRERLRLQTETGQFFPEYSRDALVPAYEMYTRVTGNVQFSTSDIPRNAIQRYRETFEIDALEEIWRAQLSAKAQLTPTIKHWSKARDCGVRPRTQDGVIIQHRSNWWGSYLHVGEVEAYVRKYLPTKIPDVEPASLADGTEIHPHQLLFLMPVRNLIEGRNDGILDVTRYMSTGRLASSDIELFLDGKNSSSIFRRYGTTQSDRELDLNPHALRHLQTTELFRLGVADTIITKRFNRQSVAQSYEYDHRSLAEDLVRIDAPGSDSLGENASQVHRMILANKISGPLVDEFLRVQRDDGDEAAFQYLNAEADGLHVTPYGFCLNSFTVDPCPKHLECYNGCRHLALSDVAEDRRHLATLRHRMLNVLERLERLPITERSIGWSNQVRHAKARLANIEIALAARPGEKPFPDGPDLYRPASELWGTTILDTVPPLRGSDG